jgi:hypothetical protein
MTCKSCRSNSLSILAGEIAIHFRGLKNIDKVPRPSISRAFDLFYIAVYQNLPLQKAI